MDFQYWKFLAGLGAFLFSINLVEEALKTLGSRNFKIILRKHTNNHFKSIIVGALSTAILQSSSAVTLMLLALVGSGIINLSNALGIILGANLGTTFTGWIVSTLGFKVDINSFIYPIMAIGSLAYVFFPSKPRLYQWGKFFFGLGFLFFGLNMMKDSMSGLQSYFDPSILAEYHYLVFALAGMVFTAIIQSSSATMTITLTALHAGIIPLEGACALMVGADLGTTGTVILGSAAGGHRKQQVAAAHFFFNLFTNIFTLILLKPILAVATKVAGLSNPLYVLVTFYSGFNLLGIIIFMPFLNLFSKKLHEKFPEESDFSQIKIDTNLAEAAIIQLFDFSSSFLKQTFDFNLSVLAGKFKKIEGQYKQLKHLESSLIDSTIEVGQKELTNEQSFKMKQIHASARNCSYSRKAVKDIVHNFEEFSNSTNRKVIELSDILKDQYLEWMHSYSQELLKSKDDIMTFENLLKSSEKLEGIYIQFVALMNSKIGEKAIDLKHVSNFFNVNRELYSSCRSLLESYADIALSEQQNKDFASIPKNID